MRDKIIAVDFDGTLIEEGKWPGIGGYERGGPQLL